MTQGLTGIALRCRTSCCALIRGRLNLVDFPRRSSKVFSDELYVFAQYVEWFRVRPRHFKGNDGFLDLRQPIDKYRPLFR